MKSEMHSAPAIAPAPTTPPPSSPSSSPLGGPSAAIASPARTRKTDRVYGALRQHVLARFHILRRALTVEDFPELTRSQAHNALSQLTKKGCLHIARRGINSFQPDPARLTSYRLPKRRSVVTFLPMNQRILDLHIRDLKAAHALQVAALQARIRQLERENRLLCRRNTKLEVEMASCRCPHSAPSAPQCQSGSDPSV